MLNKNKKIFYGILILLLLVLIGFFIYSIAKPSRTEGFEDVDPENFGSLADLDTIKSDISNIRQKLSNEYPDMSRYVQKNELPPSSVCRVATAVDKDAYIPKTEAKNLSKCPVPQNYDPTKYISKSDAMKSQGPSSCPTLNPDQWILKSSLPPTLKCPDCVAPKVKVSAGLCQKCPPPPKCPSPAPCPIVECPKPQPCPPQKECPACPPKEPCPPKICPPCPAIPTPKVCPKCCDREVIKVIKKTVYVDKNGKEYNSKEEIINKKSDTLNKLIRSTTILDSNYDDDETPNPTNRASLPSYDDSDDTLSSLRDIAGSFSNRMGSSGSGLTTPSPSPTNAGSTSTGGSLREQSNAGNVSLSQFPTPTDKPFVQSYKVDNKKACKSNAFNSEFQQYGVYGDAKNMYNEYLAL